MDCEKQCIFSPEQPQTLPPPKDHPCQPICHQNCQNVCSSSNLPTQKCMRSCQLQCQKAYNSLNPASQIIPLNLENSQIPVNPLCPTIPAISPIPNTPTATKEATCIDVCMPLCLPSCTTAQAQSLPIPPASEEVSSSNTIAPLSPSCIANCINVCMQQCLQLKLTINTCQSACQMQCANVC
ncbi:unnamed protein product [Onchocerca flexuosa]|uniref:Cysteine rich repeat-containing domain protein n=1 Tax=Onchocerca flexuosa TaxID=387005 RepID=A0A183HJ16_9BILA|nr:unnamed protein product [Onchocerca flexuosa]